MAGMSSKPSRRCCAGVYFRGVLRSVGPSVGCPIPGGFVCLGKSIFKVGPGGASVRKLCEKDDIHLFPKTLIPSGFTSVDRRRSRRPRFARTGKRALSPASCLWADAVESVPCGPMLRRILIEITDY